MAVRIRLARFGCRNRPAYRLVAADSKSRREGKSLEVLGHYDPLPCLDGIKLQGLKFDRVKYWLSVGAQPSEAACRLLNRTGQFQPPLPVLAGARKAQTPNSQSSDPLSGCYKTQEVDGSVDQPKEDEGALACLLAYPLP